MNTIIDSLNRFGLSHHAANETKFLDACLVEDIVYFETPEKYSFWASIDGESHIVVSKRWRGPRKLFIQLHELGHHALHAGQSVDQVHFFDSSSRRSEFEAHAFATMAMCPLASIEDGSFEVVDRFTDYIRRERERLYNLFHH